MQKENVTLVAENERLQREIYTKEQLLVSQEEANRSYVGSLKKEYVVLEEHMTGAIEIHSMMYEDLRSLTAIKYKRIEELEAIVHDLRTRLDSEIGLKNLYIQKLADKTEECNRFMERLEQKIKELVVEEKAH